MRRLVALFVLFALANAARLPLIEPHIAGGVKATIDKYPYHVVLRGFDTYLCSAAIISSTHVLTAAQCLAYESIKGIGWYNIQAGVSSTARTDYHLGKSFYLKKTAKHRNFKSESLDFDIGVLTLEKAIKFSALVQPIDLVPILEEPQPGEVLTVSGWGAQKGERKLSRDLQVVRIPAVSRDVCQKMFSPRKITENMICAGTNDKGIAFGDTGSPLVDSKNKLVGIGSFTQMSQFGPAKKPQIFTNLANAGIRVFIEENIM